MSGNSTTKTAQTAETGSTFWRRTLRLVLFGVLVSYLFALFFYLRCLLFEPGSAIAVDTLGSGGQAHLLFYVGAATYIPLIGAFCALVVGVLENTVVFYTGDHGEALWEHEELGHATSLYDEQIHVPLVACWPGQFEGGNVRHDPVSLTDVYATILSGLGIDYNTEATLAQPLQEPVDPNRVIYAHNLGHYGAEGTVIAPRGRLIMDPLDDPAGYELYAADDYGQTADLAAERPELVAELLELWTAYLERCARITERFNPYATEDIEELSPAQIEQLRAIGYMQ